MSTPSIDLNVPRGYVKQELSEKNTGYIKGNVLGKWLDERKKVFGSQSGFIVCESRSVPLD